MVRPDGTILKIENDCCLNYRGSGVLFMGRQKLIICDQTRYYVNTALQESKLYLDLHFHDHPSKMLTRK